MPAGPTQSDNSPQCRWLAVARGPFALHVLGLGCIYMEIAQGHGLPAVTAAGETLEGIRTGFEVSLGLAWTQRPEKID